MFYIFGMHIIEPLLQAQAIESRIVFKAWISHCTRLNSSM